MRKEQKAREEKEKGMEKEKYRVSFDWDEELQELANEVGEIIIRNKGEEWDGD